MWRGVRQRGEGRHEIELELVQIKFSWLIEKQILFGLEVRKLQLSWASIFPSEK